MEVNPLSGALVVDKPAGWTSHDVVAKVRRIAQTKKVGHLGTLDPMATGVLPLLLGRATRLAQYFGAREKCYEGVVRFGFSTDTYDAEGVPISEPSRAVPDSGTIERALQAFRGRLLQTPPPVSAKKVNGVPAYKLARRNEPVELAPVEVTIHELTILGFEADAVAIRVRCSAGTYIRSIAHDLGRQLGCGAHLRELRRTDSGEFGIGSAHTLECLGQLASEGRIAEALLPAASLLPEMPAEIVDDEVAAHIRQGREFRLSPFRPGHGSERIKAISTAGELLAIGQALLPGMYRPVCVL